MYMYSAEWLLPFAYSYGCIFGLSGVVSTIVLNIVKQDFDRQGDAGIDYFFLSRLVMCSGSTNLNLNKKLRVEVIIIVVVIANLRPALSRCRRLGLSLAREATDEAPIRYYPIGLVA
jgi:hypothetical protein